MKKLIEDEIRKYYRDTNFTVQYMAEKLNMSQSYLREIVHENFMMSPKKLIESVRLEESVTLLLTSMHIYNISIKVGYCNTRTYRLAFKNRFGISPVKFREKVKEKSYKEIKNITYTMFSRFILVIIISCLIQSCSNNIYIKKDNVHSKYERQINSLGQNKIGKIQLTEDRQFEASNIKVVEDSIIFTNIGATGQTTLPLSMINEVSFNDHIVGFSYGLLIGAGIGTAVGFIIVDRSAEIAGLGIAAYAVGFGLVGSVIGAIWGNERKYIFIETR